MPIDNSIYSQLQAPDIMGGIQNGLKMRQMLDERRDAQGIKDAFKKNMTIGPDGTPILDRKATLSSLMQISPEKAMEYQKQFTADDAAKTEQKRKELSIVANIAGSVKDQTTYDNALQVLQKANVDVSMMPKQYDKGLVDSYHASALTAMDRMNEQYRRDQLAQQERLDRQKAKDALDLEAAKAGYVDQRQGQLLTHQKEIQGMKGQQAMSLQQQKLNAIAQKAGGFTEGEKKLDADYAKDYNDFSGGGFAKAQDAIAKLKSFKEQMANDKGWVQAGGGPISGSLPDAFRTQKSISQRDNIISVANSALKATFGGALSDGERKALANEFYNDKLSNAENLKIIERKISELENGLASQVAKAEHFQKNRSLKGFQYADVPYKEAGSGGKTLKTHEIEWADDKTAGP